MESNISVSSIALQLRAVTQMEPSFFIEHKEEFEKCVGKAERRHEMQNLKTNSDVTNYYRLLNLISHVEKDSVACIWNIVHSLFLMKCLQQSGWLKPNSLSLMLTSEEIYFIKLIIHLRGITQHNTHTMSQQRIFSDSQKNMKIKEVGLAVRPSAALFNHSCWPNTVRCSSGKNVVIMSSVSIHRGDEITDSYIPIFSQLSKVERQQKLEDYKFSCVCSPCTKNWPKYKDLPLIQPKPSQIKDQVNEINLMKLLHQADMTWRGEIDRKNEEDDLLATWCKLCEQAEKHSVMPSRIFMIIRERIQGLLWKKYGNKYQDLLRN